MSRSCHILHEKFSALPRFFGNYRKEQVPDNGIYIVFEIGETAHNTDRIVRIGTHTGQDNLAKRINEHLYKLKKDRSIFRKHIGRCVLAKRGDPFLEQWEIDLTTRANREKFSWKIDPEKLAQMEKEVSAYITSNLAFAVIPVLDKTERLFLESAMLSTVAACSDCKPSKNWLGLHHPNHKIRNSGLWNVQGLNVDTLSFEEANEL